MKLPEIGDSNSHGSRLATHLFDDAVDTDQEVVNKELSIYHPPAALRRGLRRGFHLKKLLICQLGFNHNTTRLL